MNATVRIGVAVLALLAFFVNEASAGIMARFVGDFETSAHPALENQFDLMIELNNGTDSVLEQTWYAPDVVSIQIRSGSYSASLDSFFLFTLSTDPLGALKVASLGVANGSPGSDSLRGNFSPRLVPQNSLYGLSTGTSVQDTRQLTAATANALIDNQDLTGWSIEQIGNASVPEPASLAIWTVMGTVSLGARRLQRARFRRTRFRRAGRPHHSSRSSAEATCAISHRFP